MTAKLRSRTEQISTKAARLVAAVRPSRADASRTARRAVVAARSPFAAPVLWICLAMALYSLRWSALYAPLRVGLWIFLSGVVAVFAIFALKSDTGRVRSLTWPTTWWPVALIAAYFAIAFAVNGGVPVVQILLGRPYDIYGFGVPGLHVIMLAFTSYHALRYLRRGLAERDVRSYLALVLILTLVAMMGSRSALSFIVFAGLVMFLRAQRLTLGRVVTGFVVLTAFLYVFGLFGDTRLAYQIEQETGQPAREDVVLVYAEATPAFEETNLAPAWMWPYLYFSSPLANLNSAVEEAGHSVCGISCDIRGLVLYEMLPDVMGNRVASALDVPEFDKSEFLVKPDVTASTTFGSAVGYAGFVGASLVALLLLLTALATTRFLRDSPVREEGMAILSTILFFSFFENMLSYSPLSLQLGVALLAAFLITRRAAPPTWRSHPFSRSVSTPSSSGHTTVETVTEWQQVVPAMARRFILSFRTYRGRS